MVNIEFLEEISNIIQKGLGSDETFSAVFDLLEKTVPFDSASLFLYNAVEDRLEVIHQKGEDVVELASEFTFARGMGISSWVSMHDKPVILESLSKARAGMDHRFSSFVSMPLRVSEKLIGVLNLGHLEPAVYKRADIALYESMARQISIVMDKILLQSTLQDRNARLEQTLHDLEEAQGVLIEKERLAAIGEIIVTVNHEINNPLTSIISLAEILEFTHAAGNKDKVQTALKAILSEARRIQRITEKLRKITNSKAETYHGDIRMTSLPV